MKPAIRVENLGKLYRVNHAAPREKYRTLRDSLASAATAPLRRLRNGGQAGTTEDFWALKDVNFEVQPGEVVGIIGRNGAGKSTLLKVLSRITEPTQGQVRLKGRVASLLEVGTGFHPELTGRENIYLNGSILGMSRGEIEKQFDDIVEFAEVEKFLDTPVKRYSSGMYVRLAFAVAAHLEPEVLIVDEVLAVGDAAFQQKCYERMRTVSSRGLTVLLVSHQLNSVRDLCTWAVWLDRGELRRNGPAGEIIEQYLSVSANLSMAGEWHDLTSRSRSGTGEIKFIAARYSGATCQLAVAPDGPLTMRLRLSARSTVRDAQIGAYVTDRHGTRLVSLSTYHRHDSLTIPKGECEIVFSVDQLHLTPGSYQLLLIAGGLEDHFDYVSDALTLEVVDDSALDPVPIQAVGAVTRTFRFSQTS